MILETFYQKMQFLTAIVYQWMILTCIHWPKEMNRKDGGRMLRSWSLAFCCANKVAHTPPTHMMSGWINSEISGWIIKPSWQYIILLLEKQVFPASLALFSFKLPFSEYPPDARHITYIVFNLHNTLWSIIIVPAQIRRLRLQKVGSHNY